MGEYYFKPRKYAIGLIFILFLFAGAKAICYAQTATISQIQRAEEILEKERVLRDRLQKDEKTYIEEIEVQGAGSLDKGQIADIILPFQRHWLTKANIEQLLGLITQAYKQKGYKNQPDRISYRIEKKRLIIEIVESRKP